MKRNGSRTRRSEPGHLTERSELNPQRSRNVANWPFPISIIDGEVVRNVHRFDRKAFLAAQQEALL